MACAIERKVSDGETGGRRQHGIPNSHRRNLDSAMDAYLAIDQRQVAGNVVIDIAERSATTPFQPRQRRLERRSEFLQVVLRRRREAVELLAGVGRHVRAGR